MASISSTRVTAERDVVSKSMPVLLDSMSEEERQQLDQWLSEIEEYAQQSIARLKNIQVSRRRPEIIAAAAIYQSFLEFENRTQVQVRIPFISKSLGITPCATNEAYRALFDRRVKIQSHRVGCIRMSSEVPTNLVMEIVDSLQNALEEQTSRTADWLVSVQAEAISMVGSLTDAQRASYDPDVLAAAAIYGAIQMQPSRDVVQVAQKDIALTCRCSAAMVSKVWLNLFCEGRLSRTVDTERRGK